MSAPTVIDKQISNYLIKLNNKEKKAVLGIVKTLAEKHIEDEQWDDDTYLKEMNKRFNDFETGKIKPLTLEEIESRARQAYKK